MLLLHKNWLAALSQIYMVYTASILYTALAMPTQNPSKRERGGQTYTPSDNMDSSNGVDSELESPPLQVGVTKSPTLQVGVTKDCRVRLLPQTEGCILGFVKNYQAYGEVAEPRRRDMTGSLCHLYGETLQCLHLAFLTCPPSGVHLNFMERKLPNPSLMQQLCFSPSSQQGEEDIIDYDQSPKQQQNVDIDGQDFVDYDKASDQSPDQNVDIDGEVFIDYDKASDENVDIDGEDFYDYDTESERTRLNNQDTSGDYNKDTEEDLNYGKAFDSVTNKPVVFKAASSTRRYRSHTSSLLPTPAVDTHVRDTIHYNNTDTTNNTEETSGTVVYRNGIKIIVSHRHKKSTIPTPTKSSPTTHDPVYHIGNSLRVQVHLPRHSHTPEGTPYTTPPHYSHNNRNKNRKLYLENDKAPIISTSTRKVTENQHSYSLQQSQSNSNSEHNLGSTPPSIHTGNVVGESTDDSSVIDCSEISIDSDPLCLDILYQASSQGSRLTITAIVIAVGYSLQLLVVYIY